MNENQARKHTKSIKSGRGEVSSVAVVTSPEQSLFSVFREYAI